MTYDGNRLVSVQDAAQAVTMSGSRAKQGLSAREGPAELHLRAKQRLSAREGLSERQSSLSESWRYLPDGTKLSLSLSDANGPASVTDYRGNLVYKDGVLKDILADGGLIDMTEASPRYVFFLKDHLGSVRVAAMLNGMKVQTDLYYPYGMSYASSALAGSGSSTVEDGGDIQVFPGGSIPEIPGTPEIAEEFISTIPYRFCGKEQNIADGLGMYDFLARRYDPVLCRFTSPDPLAEKYPSVSPYAYCGNDPVNKVDPDGRNMSTHTDEDGRVLAIFDDGDKGIYKHGNDCTKEDIKRNHKDEDTSAGGELMGYSWQINSFDSFLNKEDARIIFNSTELTDKVDEIIDSQPSIIRYAMSAKSTGDWDIKTKVTNGSLLYGYYASPRDAGNFAAGMFSQSKGTVLSSLIDFGYGSYNLCGNKMIPTALLSSFVLAKLPYSLPLFNSIKQNGEDAISKKAQMLGKQYYSDNFK